MPGTTRPRATCANCGAAVRAKDRFCASCGTPIAAAQAAPRPAEPASASLQVSAPLDALAEQRKVVTILFADLSGSTPLAEKLDPEELRAILGSYFAALARQIHRYEGTIDKYIGDAVMAVFGAPLSHEDDAERAIRAALAMQASIVRLNDDLDRRYGVRLALRIGVNTGEVVAGMLAGDVQRAYTVVGDAVNTAQRLESAAPLGSVLVSETTRRLALHHFAFERREPVVLKGKSEPVTTYRVVSEIEATLEPEATPFVGRESELAWLADAMRDVDAGRGRILALVGEPGIGKSRLLTEFRASLPPNVDRMLARCASYETNTPYALIADAIRGVFAIHAADDEAAARKALGEGMRRYGREADEITTAVVLEVLGFAQRSDLDPQRKRALLVAFLRGLLALSTVRTPVVIALEDLHWVDETSVQVLRELVRDIPSLRCLVVTTSRPGWEPPWPSERRLLDAFDDATSRTLMEAMIDAPVDAALSDAVLGRTGGNPFFIEEVLRELRDGGALAERDGRVVSTGPGTDRLPTTVQEVLEARLDRLPDAARQVARPASVIGRTFWYRVLSAVAPDAPIADGLERLELDAFVVQRAMFPELTYAFRQALIRDVVYQTQLQSVRRRTHALVAEAMERLYPDRLDEFVDLIAFHYGRADDAVRALPWLVRAADRARRLFANDEAIALYASALGHATQDDGPLGRTSILERIGEVRVATGRYDDAIEVFGDALARAREPRTIARIRRGSATALRMKGDNGAALAELELGMAALGGREEPETVRLEIEMGQLHWRRGEYDAARTALRHAMATAERLAEGDLVAEASKHLGNVENLAGARDDAERAYRRSLALYERANDVRGIADVHSNLGSLYRRMGRFDEAIAEHQQSLQAREKMGDPWAVGTCHNNIAEVLHTRGDHAGAIPEYERAISIWEPIGYVAGVALALVGLGASRTDAGDPASGKRDLEDALARYASLGSTTYLPDLHRALASAELALGSVAAAEANAARALEYAERSGARHQVAMTKRVLGLIAARRGDRAAARALLEASRDTLMELREDAELERTEHALSAVSGS
ncbi:MAG TPA: adenylate/guanylate cyclase domain-containing protein [Candidatus Limnocylindria bacterium]